MITTNFQNLKCDYLCFIKKQIGGYGTQKTKCNGTIRQYACHFLLVVHCSYIAISYIIYTYICIYTSRRRKTLDDILLKLSFRQWLFLVYLRIQQQIARQVKSRKTTMTTMMMMMIVRDSPVSAAGALWDVDSDVNTDKQSLNSSTSINQLSSHALFHPGIWANSLPKRRKSPSKKRSRATFWKLPKYFPGKFCLRSFENCV